MSDMIAAASAIREAVSILSKGGAYRRALDIHHRGTGSRCASCGQHSPCSIEQWANAAKGQVEARIAREARAVERAARAGMPLESTPGLSEDGTKRISAEEGATHA